MAASRGYTDTVIHYFYGEDTYGAAQALQTLVEKHGARVRYLDKESLEERPLRLWLEQAQGNLFDQEIIVLRDPTRLPASLQASIVAAISTQPKVTFVLWDREKVDRRTALFKAVLPLAQHFPAWPRERLARWLTEEASRQQETISPTLAFNLVDSYGPDRWRLKNELEKYLLLAPQQREVQQFKENGYLVGNVWQVADELLAGRTSLAVKNIEKLVEGGVHEVQILSALAYQFRVLLLLNLHGTKAKLSAFVVQKNLAKAKKFTTAQLMEILVRILAVDSKIKTGAASARTALLLSAITLSRS